MAVRPQDRFNQGHQRLRCDHVAERLVVLEHGHQADVPAYEVTFRISGVDLRVLVVVLDQHPQMFGRIRGHGGRQDHESVQVERLGGSREIVRPVHRYRPVGTGMSA
ncbi:hypothetical protein [Streptomyces sp. NPDC090021]|uniref:hypothetical protein n=1 Tax=Streptomyces sp. NPDC090021 TaxID=3365919 RepID=UPI0038010AF5